MQATVKRNVVCIDTRRTVNMLAMARKPGDVAKEGHEQFIRNQLKDRLGWPRREPAPQAIKDAARSMAAFLVLRDKALAITKAEAKAAEAKRIADMEADVAVMEVAQ